MPDDLKQNEISQGRPEEKYADGIVIRSTGSWYDVMVGDDLVPSKIRGRFRLSEDDVTNPVSVGDRVRLLLNADDTGMIIEIYERKNKLSRRAAGRRVGREHIIVTNIDRVWTIQSVRLPTPNPGFIDRVLAVAEAHEIDAGIVLNKIDLLEEDEQEELEELRNLYAGLGYPVLLTSAETGEGLDAFRSELADRTSVLTGPSGVGKSSILNGMEPELELRTAEVSAKTRKGRHTTTSVSLFPLSNGGYIVDTPGIREFGLLDIEPWELSHYFVEFRPFIDRCRFPTCTHDHEPECGVKQAVEAGEISEQRYRSYLNILDSINLGEKDVGR